jgi:hypothetical protein
MVSGALDTGTAKAVSPEWRTRLPICGRCVSNEAQYRCALGRNSPKTESNRYFMDPVISSRAHHLMPRDMDITLIQHSSSQNIHYD